ncbi:hypothetical protein B0T20DRAFT_388534 [Sordaria brevicollis]|uniref:Uncharacterized protein n=1 Tax=Sordaria brevicollis TaxID=83679 RepID=A0AAE0PML7_SORBR|nr:hypothetical protein B0T20DRAFT_388534 [Sordaria brevicollis]
MASFQDMVGSGVSCRAVEIFATGGSRQLMQQLELSFVWKDDPIRHIDRVGSAMDRLFRSDRWEVFSRVHMLVDQCPHGRCHFVVPRCMMPQLHTVAREGSEVVVLDGVPGVSCSFPRPPKPTIRTIVSHGHIGEVQKGGSATHTCRRLAAVFIAEQQYSRLEASWTAVHLHPRGQRNMPREKTLHKAQEGWGWRFVGQMIVSGMGVAINVPKPGEEKRKVMKADMKRNQWRLEVGGPRQACSPSNDREQYEKCGHDGYLSTVPTPATNNKKQDVSAMIVPEENDGLERSRRAYKMEGLNRQVWGSSDPTGLQNPPWLSAIVFDAPRLGGDVVDNSSLNPVVYAKIVPDHQHSWVQRATTQRPAVLQGIAVCFPRHFRIELDQGYSSRRRNVFKFQAYR